MRKSPDSIYDRFKIKGHHILNAMGIVGSPKDLHYLNEYKYVTVRSNSDKEKLSYLKKEVHIVPDTTIIFEDIKDFNFNPKRPSIGIHLLPNMFNEPEKNKFISMANSLIKDGFTIYFLPITLYCNDYVYMQQIANQVSGSIMLPIMNPLEIFTTIGKMDYFISTSLHGGIFSLVHNVPFILYNFKNSTDDKMRFYMQDRGIERYLFDDVASMKNGIVSLINSRPDYSDIIKKDRDVLNEHIYNLKQLLK